MHAMERLLACTHCRKRFRTPSALARHMATHRPERPWVCAACGHSAKSKSSLMEHIVVLHCPVLLWRRGHRCRWCRKPWMSVSARAAHERSHTGERMTRCRDCGKGFASKHAGQIGRAACRERV